MRKIIAALQVSLDGFIEGPDGEIDWIDSWEDPFDILPQIDACILGGRMYPGYEQYWGTIQADPKAVLPFSGKTAAAGEISYARFAAAAPHYVVSRTLNNAAWTNTTIIGDLEDIRALKRQPGKDMHAVGGASLVSNLVNAKLVDEIRLVVSPIILGGGKALFKDVESRHQLKLRAAEPLASGMARLTYVMG